MTFKIVKKNKRLKTFCLNKRLKRLENLRSKEIQKIINLYPLEAAKMDNIEKSFPTDNLRNLSLKIKATQKLLNSVSKN